MYSGACPWCQKNFSSIFYRHPNMEGYCDTCISLRSQELQKLWVHLDRAQTKGLPTTLTIDQWMKTLFLCDWKCAYCRERPYRHLEHYVPLRHGGGTTQDNCVPACQVCNKLKHQCHPDKVTGIPKQDIERVYEFLQSLKNCLQTLDIVR